MRVRKKLQYCDIVITLKLRFHIYVFLKERQSSGLWHLYSHPSVHGIIHFQHSHSHSHSSGYMEELQSVYVLFQKEFAFAFETNIKTHPYIGNLSLTLHSFWCFINTQLDDTGYKRTKRSICVDKNRVNALHIPFISSILT